MKVTLFTSGIDNTLRPFSLHGWRRRNLLLFSLGMAILTGFTACTASPTLPDEIHIVYTANLNGALTDCNCGGNIVGGMSRSMTLIDSLRGEHPDLLLFDGGDALHSYPLPEANRAMLQLLGLAQYDAINVGEQEFVESDSFILAQNRLQGSVLPFISANTITRHKGNQFPGFLDIRLGDYPVTIIGLREQQEYNFSRPSKVSVSPADQALAKLKNRFEIDIGLQILLFHGSPGQVTTLLEANPWIDVVILGHNQVQLARRISSAIILEPGYEGEYLGYLTIRQSQSKWLFENVFIPIESRTPPHDAAIKIVSDYYQSLSN